MKTLSASSFTRPRRALLAAGGSLAFFLLPFVLFHPEKKPVVSNSVSKRNIEYIPAGREAEYPRLSYLLRYHDPGLFLFPGEKRGFALFRVRPVILEPAASSGIRPDILFPPRLSGSSVPAMRPAPLPRSETAFSAPLTFPLFRMEPANREEAAEIAKQGKFVPAIRTSSGEALPGSRITGFSESEIRTLHPQGPTLLLVEPPSLPDLTGHAGILRSCGVPRLDAEACRLLNLLLQKESIPDSFSGSVFSVHWVAPETSPAFSAKIREEKEEEPAS